MKLLKPYEPLFINPPLTRYFFITGGRGSGKSFHVSTLLLNLTYEPGHVILFTRWTLSSAHISIIPEFLGKIKALNVGADFNIKATEIVNNKTGSRIVFRGIKKSSGEATANLKSIEGLTTWVLDEGEEMHDEYEFDDIDLSVRHKDLPNRVIIVMNPASTQHMLYKKFIEEKRSDTTYIHTDYRINKSNLSESYIEQAERMKKTNMLRYRHIWLGEWIEGSEGILWNEQIIERSRAKKLPELVKKVIAIDPAVTANSKSDETGIILGGITDDNHIYILEDISGRYTPAQWAETAKEVADAHDIDYYVAEGNQGHDLVASNLQQVDPNRLIKMVTATRGKYVRAEPVYALYEQDRVHHAGHLITLERQMINWNPDDKTQSPDRVDALVWCVTDLMKGKEQEFILV